ncbi:nucleotidyltransferase domain-containing protein [Rossellomorea aquimaris]|uniref:nucleotidyltransferase domain-containing protein n=1 Tax=Rossellomorea aquimaris TaxID=189382 RepID=UPI0007D04EF1|nr:nucleotidyltransferase family protein [Rossellomorea aquimaris]
MDKKSSLDLSQIPKELKLIIELIKNNNSVELTRVCSELASDIDWNLFVDQAIHHRVFPLLQSKIKMIETKMIPSNVINRLTQTYRESTFRMLQMCAEMKTVSTSFNEKSIRLIQLKGPVLAQFLYNDVSRRTSSDLDVLISIEDLGQAEKLLKRMGYVKEEYIKSILNDWRWRHHHVTYFHPEKGMKLELHWRLNPGPGKEPSFEELWERKQISSLSTSEVYSLGNEDLFLFLVTHGARHGWSRLRWLTDIHQIIERGLSWKKVYQLLKKYDYLHIGGQAVVLTTELFNTKCTREMKPHLFSKRSRKLAQEAIFYLEKMVNLHTDPVPHYISSYHSQHLFSLMSNKQRLFFLISQLHPYFTDAETLPLPIRLHFLYFPLRPFLVAWRKTRKHATS